MYGRKVARNKASVCASTAAKNQQEGIYRVCSKKIGNKVGKNSTNELGKKVCKKSSKELGKIVTRKVARN